MSNAQVLYAESVAGETAATTAWVDTASIPASSFTANKRYLVIANLISINDSASVNARMRLVHGTTPTVFTDGLLNYEGLVSTQEHEESWLFDFTQPGTTELIKLQISSAVTSTVTSRLAQIICIKLDDDFTSGTDYFWAEDLNDYTMTGSPVAKALTGSFTPNGTDRWLFIGHMIHDVVGITTPIGFELYDSVAGVLNTMQIEGEDAASDIRGQNVYWVGVPTNAARTLAVRPFGSASDIMLASRVIAINLARFAQSASAYNATGVDPATTPTYTTLATVAPTPTNTGNWVYLAFSTQDVNQTTTDWETRLQVNPDGGGLVSDPNYPTTAPSIDNWDATDLTPHSIFKVRSLSSGGARTINWDCRQVAGTTGLMANNGLVAFSVELALAAITGTLNQTLGTATLSGTGTAAVAGSASPTLGALTPTASGTLDISGSLSQTLGAATLAGTATVGIVGSLSATLGEATLAATGTISTTILGSLDQALGTLTASATGTAGIEGVLSQSLGAATLAGTASVAIEGSLSQTLGAATLAATAMVDCSGMLDSSLGAATLSGTGALAVAGTATLVLDALISAGTATVSMSGSLSATLGGLALEGQGFVGAAPLEGILNVVLGTLTGSATGTEGIAGTATSTLGAMSLAGTATLDIAGTASLTFGTIVLTAMATVSMAGTATPTLGALVLAGTASSSIVGGLNETLSTMTVTGTGGVGLAGVLSVILDDLVCEATGTVAEGITIFGELNAVLGVATMAGIGGQPVGKVFCAVSEAEILGELAEQGIEAQLVGVQPA